MSGKSALMIAINGKFVELAFAKWVKTPVIYFFKGFCLLYSM